MVGRRSRLHVSRPFVLKMSRKKAKQNLKQIIITTVSQNINEIKVCIYKDPVDVFVFALNASPTGQRSFGHCLKCYTGALLMYRIYLYLVSWPMVRPKKVYK